MNIHKESSENKDNRLRALYDQRHEEKPLNKEFFIKNTLEQDPDKGMELLFKAYYRPLCSHAARFVYSKDIAEDIVGEVFENFWKKKI